eukprot:4381753-Amphidinium_carterae.1
MKTLQTWFALKPHYKQNDFRSKVPKSGASRLSLYDVTNDDANKSPRHHKRRTNMQVPLPTNSKPNCIAAEAWRQYTLNNHSG